MADPYRNFIATATKLINKWGRPAVLRTETATGDEWNPTLSQVEVPIIVFSSNYTATEIDGTLIQSADVKFLVDSTVNVTPESKIVDDDGKVYDIVDVVVVRGGTPKVISKIQARLTK